MSHDPLLLGYLRLTYYGFVMTPYQSLHPADYRTRTAHSRNRFTRRGLQDPARELNGGQPAHLIEVSELSFAYPTVPVFERFSWSTSAPLTVIQGPSGCGKTTLLKLLARQLVPERGQVRCALSPRRLILQDDALFPWLRVDGNLGLSPDWEGWDGFSAPLDALADLVEPLRRRHAAFLSFGQRRTVELFRVLSGKARLLLLDEPLNFLDSAKRGLVVECLRARASDGTAIVVTTTTTRTSARRQRHDSHSVLTFL